jgi:methionyl-tRNA formyltransferase
MKPSVIFLGSKPGAVVALRTLVERGWDVRCVVVCPKFDYEWICKPTVQDAARSLDLPVVSKQADLAGISPADFVISYMYRYLVQAPIRALSERAAVNFHAAPLPEYGGWAFYNVAILEGAKQYGCTCHYMDDGFDTGPLLKVRRFPIDATQETAWSLERKTQLEMQKLFIDFCELAETGAALPCENQDPARVRYLRREQFDQLKEIPIGADLETIDRTARAFWYPPYRGAYMLINDTRVEIYPGLDREVLARLIHADDVNALSEAGRPPIEKIGGAARSE